MPLPRRLPGNWATAPRPPRAPRHGPLPPIKRRSWTARLNSHLD